MYAIANKGTLPYEAKISPERMDDWIFWQADRITNIDDSAIAPYLGRPVNPQILTCPTDPYNELRGRTRTNSPAQGPYPFSYSMNSMLVDTVTNYGGTLPQRMLPLARIRNSSDKCLIFEEDEATIDDGYGTLPQGSGINLLAVRHDRPKHLPDDPTTGISQNGDRRGNVGFVDGHAEFMSRSDLHTPFHYDPSK